MFKIIPAILTNNFAELKQKLESINGITDKVHIDIADTAFSPSPTIRPNLLKRLNREFLFDFHLMVENPLHLIEQFRSLPTDTVIAQVEYMKDQRLFINEVKKMGARAGLALDIQTPVSSLSQELLGRVDVVLVMGVKAGASGQVFRPEALAKIKRLKSIKDKYGKRFAIMVDGGVNKDTVAKIHQAGADVAVAATAIFSGNPDKNMAELLRKAK